MTWEQRWHPLRREWVVVAAHRQSRPWSGEVAEHTERDAPQYESDCYLCPGNTRVSGVRNERYEQAFVFDNDHPPVGPSAPNVSTPPDSIYQAQAALGRARVVCYSPRHDLSLSELSTSQIENLLGVLQDEYRSLSKDPNVNHVLVFENRGEAVGVSNPHPHCQIYGTNFVFKTMELEFAAEAQYQKETGRILFQDIISAEERDGRRMIANEEGALGFIPYFARYSYETLVAPRVSHPSLATLSSLEISALARALKTVLVSFDNLWQMPFPYVMVLHQAPTDGNAYPAHHFYVQFLPPLRRRNLLKYLAGPEIGGGCFISDSAPESSALEIQRTPKVHYKHS